MYGIKYEITFWQKLCYGANFPHRTLSFINAGNHRDARFKLKVYICVFQDPV